MKPLPRERRLPRDNRSEAECFDVIVYLRTPKRGTYCGNRIPNRQEWRARLPSPAIPPRCNESFLSVLSSLAPRIGEEADNAGQHCTQRTGLWHRLVERHVVDVEGMILVLAAPRVE